MLVPKTEELLSQLAFSDEKKKKLSVDIFHNPSFEIPTPKEENTISHLKLVENLLISVKEIHGLNNTFPALNGDILDSVYFEMGVYYGGHLFPSSFVRSQIVDVRKSSQFLNEILQAKSNKAQLEKTLSQKNISISGASPPLESIPNPINCSTNLISGIEVWKLPRVNI